MNLTSMLAVCATAAMLASGFASAAHAADPTPEEKLKARQGLFETLRFQCGAFGPFGKGEGALPADALERAENLAALAKLLPTTFGTEELAQSKAKHEVVSERDKFLTGFKSLNADAVKLSEALKANNADTIKTQIAALGKDCKSCHDDYREK